MLEDLAVVQAVVRVAGRKVVGKEAADKEVAGREVAYRMAEHTVAAGRVRGEGELVDMEWSPSAVAEGSGKEQEAVLLAAQVVAVLDRRLFPKH